MCVTAVVVVVPLKLSGQKRAVHLKKGCQLNVIRMGLIFVGCGLLFIVCVLICTLPVHLLRIREKTVRQKKKKKSFFCFVFFFRCLVGVSLLYCGGNSASLISTVYYATLYYLEKGGRHVLYLFYALQLTQSTGFLYFYDHLLGANYTTSSHWYSAVVVGVFFFLFFLL